MRCHVSEKCFPCEAIKNECFSELDLENHRLRTENEKLKEELKLLYALQSAGVDNWEGYEIALESLD